MAGGGKKKTTMAKLNRENRQREKRAEKNARKEARKSGLVPTPSSAEDDEVVEDAWQLTRGLDSDQL
jgi:hypothetical protein